VRVECSDLLLQIKDYSFKYSLSLTPVTNRSLKEKCYRQAMFNVINLLVEKCCVNQREMVFDTDAIDVYTVKFNSTKAPIYKCWVYSE